MADRDGNESDGSSHSSIDDDHGIPEGWESGNRTNSIDNGTESGASANPVKPNVPLQKRRRVTRACDCCRRKKIKCDGKQPCTHCTVYSYECTYDQPSNRRRNPTPQYIEALENRVQQLDELVKVVLPDIDINHPNFDVGKLPQIRLAVKKILGHDGDGINAITTASAPSEPQEALLETMVEATGRLDIDESGRLDFHGHSSGFTYLNKLREQFGDLLGQDVGSSTLLRLRPFKIVPPMPRALSIASSPNQNYSGDSVPLPPKAVAKELVSSCLNEACSLFKFIHSPTFEPLFDRIYRMDPDDYGNEEHLFLPLFYLALAVGCLFTRKAEALSIKNVLDEGAKYFGAGRLLVDITDCRDVTSLQCVLLMIFFLQSSAKLATCYSYIAIAVSASFRLGLHRKIPFPDPIECEVRKRIFCTIQKMDISISALIGLPRLIHEEDVDQEYPVEVDDEYITKSGITPGIEGQPNDTTAANAHTKLVQILGKVVKKIYPIKGLQPSTCGKRSGYMISYAVVREIEQDLVKWHDALPSYLQRGDDAPVRFIRSQHLLRVSYCHVKMMLYRPFIHYVAKPRDGRVRDERPFASAAACINTSREIVHLCQQMREKEILGGAYWFLIYTTFFSVLSLVYFVLENITHPDAPAILRDASIGKDCIMTLTDSSMAGERCSAALKPLFDQLPKRLRDGFGSAATKKRGRAASPPSLPLPSSVNESEAPPLINQRKTPHPLRRSDTFPSGRRVSDNDLSPRSSVAMFDANNSRRGSHEPVKLETDAFSGLYTPTETQDPNYSLQQHLGGLTGLPDLNALMFPASTSMAYGSQPMLFDSPAGTDIPMDSMFTDGMRATSSGRGSFATSSPSYDNVEVQLYGPLPPYMFSGESNGHDTPDTAYTGPQTAMETGMGMDHIPFDPFGQHLQNGSSGQQARFNSTSTTGNYHMNLDEFFSNQLNDADWEHLMGQQAMR